MYAQFKSDAVWSKTSLDVNVKPMGKIAVCMSEHDFSSAVENVLLFAMTSIRRKTIRHRTGYVPKLVVSAQVHDGPSLPSLLESFESMSFTIFSSLSSHRAGRDHLKKRSNKQVQGFSGPVLRLVFCHNGELAAQNVEEESSSAANAPHPFYHRVLNGLSALLPADDAREYSVSVSREASVGGSSMNHYDDPFSASASSSDEKKIFKKRYVPVVSSSDSYLHRLSAETAPQLTLSPITLVTAQALLKINGGRLTNLDLISDDPARARSQYSCVVMDIPCVSLSTSSGGGGGGEENEEPPSSQVGLKKEVRGKNTFCVVLMVRDKGLSKAIQQKLTELEQNFVLRDNARDRSLDISGHKQDVLFFDREEDARSVREGGYGNPAVLFSRDAAYRLPDSYTESFAFVIPVPFKTMKLKNVLAKLVGGLHTQRSDAVTKKTQVPAGGDNGSIKAEANDRWVNRIYRRTMRYLMTFPRFKIMTTVLYTIYSFLIDFCFWFALEQVDKPILNTIPETDFAVFRFDRYSSRFLGLQFKFIRDFAAMPMFNSVMESKLVPKITLFLN
jgi:hypothetical protein